MRQADGDIQNIKRRWKEESFYLDFNNRSCSIWVDGISVGCLWENIPVDRLKMYPICGFHNSHQTLFTLDVLERILLQCQNICTKLFNMYIYILQTQRNSSNSHKTSGDVDIPTSNAFFTVDKNCWCKFLFKVKFSINKMRSKISNY